VQPFWEKHDDTFVKIMQLPFTPDGDGQSQGDSDDDDTDDDWLLSHNIRLTDYKCCCKFSKLCTQFVKYYMSDVQVDQEMYDEMRNHFREQFKINIDNHDELKTMFEHHKWLVSYWRWVKKTTNNSPSLNSVHFSNHFLYQEFYMRFDAVESSKKPTTLDDDGIPQHPLIKIKNKDGKIRYDSGHYPKKSCFICRGWVRKYRLTSYQCQSCGMPICNPDTVGIRNDKIGLLIRTKTCLDEHLSAVHPTIKCGGDYNHNSQFPVHHKHWKTQNQKYIHPCVVVKTEMNLKKENQGNLLALI
jgi:hypothetical protein